VRTFNENPSPVTESVSKFDDQSIAMPIDAEGCFIHLTGGAVQAFDFEP
jgi:hypothetical protein